MGRKSQAQRIEDAKTTYSLWADAGHASEKPALFISQMIHSMERGKYPTKGQRSWLDSLVEEGAAAFPKVHNVERLARIDKAIATVGVDNVNVLSDFRFKLKKGWDLSGKQEAFLESILQQAEEIQRDGLPEWSDEEHILIDAVLRFGSNIKQDYYGYSNNKIERARNIKNFYDLHGTISKSHMESLQYSFKGAFRDLTSGKFPVGSLVRCGQKNGVVVRECYVDQRGSLRVDVLVDGVIEEAAYSHLGKRLKK